MNKKFAIVLLMFGLFVLAACAAGNTPPTPTVVPAEQAGLLPTPTPPVLPTRTPIPLPSPTPTPTPLVLPSLFTPTPTPESTTPLAEVIVAALNVRRGPGTGYPVVAAASAGDRFNVVGIDPSAGWLQVVMPSGEPGWISARPVYVRLLGVTPDELPFVEPPDVPQTADDAAAATPFMAASLPGRLVFTTASGGELYSINANGTNLRRLAGGAIDPALSPDGRQVAFTRWDGAEFGALFTLSLDSGQEKVVVGDIRQPKSPAWSPDGRQIVLSFQRGGLRDPVEKCKEFDFDDNIRLGDDIAKITKTRVSRDGIVICYIPKKDLRWGLRRVDVATGRFEDLPVDDYSYNPAWDPRHPWRVIYDGDKGLVQLDITQNTRWPITTDLRDTGPVFSPDGRMLALTYRQHDHWEVYTLDLETGRRSRLTKPPLLADPQYSSAAPAWSPDGKYLAFVTNRTGRWEIWVMHADGRDPRPLFNPEIQARLGLDYQGVNERILDWTR